MTAPKRRNTIQPGCSVAVPAGGTCAAANRRALNPVNWQLLPAVLIGAFVPGTGDPTTAWYWD
jgi:hypothetical protein